MRILYIIDVANPHGNGVAYACGEYANYMSKTEKVAIWNLGASLPGESKMATKYGIFNFGAYKTIGQLPDGFNEPDLVVFNEVYKTGFLKIYKECMAKGIKYVIIPHGCLVRIAQQKKKVKKLIGNNLIFRKFLKNAAAVQFLNRQELKESIFYSEKAIISKNGYSSFAAIKNTSITNNLVYVGRYEARMKGLDILMKTVNENKNWFRGEGVKLELYGRRSGKGLGYMERYIRTHKLSDVIELNGPIYGEEKIKKIMSSYGFIQLSRHEGQPLGVIEALALGTPCIVTDGTTFREYVEEKSCGVGTESDAGHVFEAIKKLYHSDREALSRNAKDAIRQDFGWNAITDELRVEYRKLLNG